MIITKNSNQVSWIDLHTYTLLPNKLKPVEELAHNLWWAWTPRAQDLFAKLSPELWEKSEGNPVYLYKHLKQEDIQRILSDEALCVEIDEVYSLFQSYMSEPADEQRPSVAYFSMEYGLSNVLKIYSGGLGVLAGDYLKEASDSNVRLTAVGFLYRYGYFTQTLSSEGKQIANYEAQIFNELPAEQVLAEDGNPLVLEVPYAHHTVYSYVWRVRVGRIDLYLLDTDLDRNSEWDRFITHQLYGGDWENRMKQEYLLGIGGVLLLNRLGIKKQVYHMNEGHAAFMNVQRLLDFVEGEGREFDFALELVRASSLYTVHTPVPAGHDSFAEDLMFKYLGHIPTRLGISWGEFMDMGREHMGSDEKFSMSAFALNTCQEANGVSKLHGQVSQQMFAPMWNGFFPEELHVGYVTNGVHMPTWAAPAWQTLYAKYLGQDYVKNQTREEVWTKIQQIDNAELWAVRTEQKYALVDYIRSHYGDRWIKNSDAPEVTKAVLESIDPNALLIGFGRRFATYKRAHLLFTDLERLERIVNNPHYPVQFLFTGKAHPADGGGQGLIQRVLEISRMPQFLGKVIFLENYDMRLASKLIAGVDIWMNTPTRPLEASGTSGEKAEMNGVLNLSVLDGWWYEGYRSGAGWALTEKRTFQNQALQDRLDATTIYDMLEREIIPLHFEGRNGKPYSDAWVQYIKNSLNYIAPHYTMRRMMDDYYKRFYTKLAERSAQLQANNAQLVEELVAWKREVAVAWGDLGVRRIGVSNQTSTNLDNLFNGTENIFEVELDLGRLSCTLDVELVVAQEVDGGKVQLVEVLPLQMDTQREGARIYTRSFAKTLPGHYKVALRILPTHRLLPHRMDFAYVRWVALA